MTLTTSFALFTAMLALAILPGPSVLLVVAKALDRGMSGALATTVGVVTGDYVFILLAVAGLTAAAEAMGSAFIIIKYLGAAYLIWLGVSLLTSERAPTEISLAESSSFLKDWSTGLITTLANPKAIVFYVSFFPAFLDLQNLNALDVMIVLFIVTLCLVPVLLAYAWLALKSRQIMRVSRRNKVVSTLCGGLLIGSGTWLALES